VDQVGVLMDSDNSASKYSQHITSFKDGCPEGWIKWVMSFHEIENLVLMKKPADKTRMFWTLLKGQDLSYFEHHTLSVLMAFREIENLMPMKEPADKIRMFWTLLKVQAMPYFEHQLWRRLEIEDSEIPDNELIELMLGKMNMDVEYIS
jgi:hypothetical protein